MDLIDSWYVHSSEIEGLMFKVYLEKDHLTTDKDFGPGDAYDDADWAAWRRDEWEFVTVYVLPVYKGTSIGTRQVDLGGVEWGELPTVSIGREYFEKTHPLPDDLIPMVMDQLAEKPLTLEDLTDDERAEYRPSGLEIVAQELAELTGILKHRKLHELKAALTPKETS